MTKQTKVNTPLGETITVNAPDDATDEEILQYARDNYKPSWGATLKDYGKSAAIAVPNFLTGMAGLPGTFKEGVGEGIDWLADKAGIRPQNAAPLSKLPSGESIKQAVEGVTGEFYEPKTEGGKLIEAGTEAALPSPIGKGKLAFKLASGVASGVGSELAGEAAEGTGYEGLARVAGGFATGSAVGFGRSAIEKAKNNAKLFARGDVQQASRNAYKDIENSWYQDPTGVVSQKIPEPVRNNLGASISIQLENGPLHSSPDIAPLTFKTIERYLGKSGDMSMADMLSLHERLGNITEGGDRVAAIQAREMIRTWFSTQLPSGKMREALGNWAAYAKLSEIDKAEEVAIHRAAVSGTGSNVQNTMRQEIRKILDNNPQFFKNLTPEAREIATRIVEGTPLENGARWLGRFAPTGLHSSAAFVIFSSLLNSAVPAGVAGTGYAAKKLADLLTAKGIADLKNEILGSAPLNENIARLNRQLAVQDRMIAQQSAARGAAVGYMQEPAEHPYDVLDNPSQVPVQ